MKVFCFYGPESTGKSTMAKKMAAHFHTEYVPETAREIITSPTFSLADIEQTGFRQVQRVIEKMKTATRYLFCDTDTITTQLYSLHYLKAVPAVLHQLENIIVYDHYFFFEPDVPWIKDNLRTLENKRMEMRTLFLQALTDRKINFTRVHGAWENREQIILETIQKKFSDEG